MLLAFLFDGIPRFKQLIKEIMAAVSIPVMAKVRIGHFGEAQILEALGVDMIDESEGIVASIYIKSFAF